VAEIKLECLDCLHQYVNKLVVSLDPSNLWGRRAARAATCPSCRSRNIQIFDNDAREAKIAANPATLPEGEVVAFVNSWLTQYHPKKSESSLNQKTFGEKCGWERIRSATWNGEYWFFPQGRFYEATRSVDRSWPPECFK